jgi:hypothetical protein
MPPTVKVVAAAGRAGVAGWLHAPPVAWETLCSSSGACTACRAACTALSGPEAQPVPIMAVPALRMTDWMSAMSMLTWPGVMIMSEMPCRHKPNMPQRAQRCAAQQDMA